ncbi:MAG TPA: FAD-dependent oxidoreductase, partial [Solirubrobacteraceae bacterium]|nr:FAD-dependent oxidoreductase [Solirubrobacteraceae bacterium]
MALSFWLETAGGLAPRPSLDGSADVDVAVLGAGYTGLWTAYELLRREPSLRVAVVERAYAGFGASGRNGGWCSSDLSLGLGGLTRRFGRDGARALQLAMFDTVDEIGRVCAAEGIDVQYEKGGMLLVARGRHQLADLEAAHQEYVAAGFGDRFTLLDAAQVHERVRVADVEAGIATDECAVVHPGRLVRGLAAAVERRGGVIYEDTPVTRFDTGSAPRLHTPEGVIHARTIVLAGEAYLTQFRRLHRRLLPVYSLIVVTEPVDDALWDEIGWRRRECLASMRLTVDYFSRTADGRIVVGGRGAPYHYGSRIKDEYDRHAPTHEMLRGTARSWFPALRGVRFTHAWG